MQARRLTCLAALLCVRHAQAEVSGADRDPPPRVAPAEVSAPPELALGAAQLVLAPRRALFDRESPDPVLRAGGFVQLTGGGSAGGDLGAGVAAALSGLGCDAVSGSAQGRLRPTADLRLVGSASWSLCLSRIGITLQLDGRDGAGLAPSMSARRSLWSRRYDDSERTVTLGLGEAWTPGSPHRHSIFVVALGHGTTTQNDGATRRHIVEIDADVALYRYRHITAQRELTVEAMVFTDDAIKAGNSSAGAVTYSALPARIQLATRDASFTIQGGMGATGGSTIASSTTSINGRPISSWSDEIDSTGLPRLRAPVGSVTAAIRREPFHIGASLSRAFYPTFDGNLALDTRLSGTAQWFARGRRRASIALAPFIAHTTTWARDAAAVDEIDLGASLHASYALDRRLNLDAIGEAGRTPYTRLDGARLADSFGGHVLVALTAHVAR